MLLLRHKDRRGLQGRSDRQVQPCPHDHPCGDLPRRDSHLEKRDRLTASARRHLRDGAVATA